MYKYFLIVIIINLIRCNIFDQEDNLPNPYILKNKNDNLFVRALLDSNGQFTTPANEVIDIQGNEIRSVGLTPVNSVLVLTDIIDSFPKGLIIGATTNTIVSVKVLKKLKKPVELLIDKNSLSNYPLDLFNLAESSSVSIAYNQLTTFPNEITNFKFKSFIFMHNYICNPPDTIKNWLNGHYPNWKKYQTCQ